MSSLLLADNLDQKMVLALRRNARISIADLAGKLKITRATVRKRMQKLHQSGAIIGYTVVLSSDVSEMPVRGLMQIKVKNANNEKIIEKLTEYTGIVAIHTANGKWDIVLELAAESLPRFDQMTRKIRQIKGVIASEISILLSTTRSTKDNLSDSSYHSNLNQLNQF